MADATLNYDVNIHGEDGVTTGFRKVAASIDDTDKAAHKASGGMDVLSQRLAKAQTDAALLRREFAETGEIGILKEITKADREVKRVSGWIKQFGDDTDHTSNTLGLFARMTASAGEGVVSLGTKLASGTGLMNPYVLAVGAGVAANAALVVTAATGGLVLAGLGGAAIAAGAKVRSGSAAMEDALTGVGKSWHDVLFDSSAIIEREMVPALGQLSGLARAIEPHLTDLFIGPSTAIGPLTQGIVGLTNNALPGLEDAANTSGEVLKVIATELPNLGAVVGGFFTDISEGAAGGANALLLVIHVLEIMISNLGRMISAGEKAWTWLENFGSLSVIEGLAASMSDVGTQNEKVASSGHSAARAIEDEGREAEAAKNATRNLSEALGLLNFDSLTAAQAQIQSTQATNRFAEAMKNNKNALNGNSTAALANRSAALSALEGYARTADEVGKLTNDTGKSTASFYANVGALRASVPAHSAARAQIDALISTFVTERGVALRSADSVASVNAQIALLHDKKVKAEARGDAGEVIRLKDAINALRNRTVYVTAVVRRTSGISEVVNYGANPTGGQQRAAGGEIAAGSAYLVGETGREMFIPNEDGRMLSARRTNEAMAGGGGGSVTNYITVTTGADPAAVVAAIQKYAQTNTVRWKGGVAAA